MGWLVLRVGLFWRVVWCSVHGGQGWRDDNLCRGDARVGVGWLGAGLASAGGEWT